jgi:uncharacterized protein (TIGR03000 family)
MFLRSVSVLLLAGVLAWPGTVQAAHGFRGGFSHGGFAHGGIYHGGIYHGGIYHGGIYHGGYGHGYYGYPGYGYYPRYYGYCWGGYYPYLSTPYYYPAPSYTGIYSVPAYTSIEVTPPVVTNNPVPEEPSGISPASYTSANAALVEVRVPADADVWVMGDKTQQKGEDRLFTSPPLEPGHRYTYDVKASWMDHGNPVEVQRHISVQAGERTVVDFRKP